MSVSETKLLLAFSGKKKSGKNALTDFLSRNAKEIFDLDPSSVRQYAFADPIKRFCIDVLGLEERICYGTNEEKNQTLTRYKWEDMPFRGTMILQKAEELYKACGGDDYLACVREAERTLPAGNMTYRQVLQTVGTETGRAYHKDLWIEATFRLIQKEQPEIAVITDMRFPNEVEATKAVGGRIIRLTRNPSPDDKHISETALDEGVFDWARFDAVVDNQTLSLTETCQAVANHARKWIL